MTIRLETVARRQAVFAAIQSYLFFVLFTASWLISLPFGPSISWLGVLGISLAAPVVLMLFLSPERIGNRLAKYLRPQPPSRAFENVVNEIALAVVEPVESIQTFDCSVANIAMLPCSGREIVVATTGALERLNRHEMQALVAAQFAGMRDPWCRLATRAEIMWWLVPWLFPLTGVAFVLEKFVAMAFCFFSLFVWAFAPRWTEQARDLCADVAAVRKTLDPQALGSAMRKLAEQADEAHEIKFGPWYLPTNPFIVVPKRVQSSASAGSGETRRNWTSADEVRMELLLRADRAEAMAKGADPHEYTGREYRKRWSDLGRDNK